MGPVGDRPILQDGSTGNAIKMNPVTQLLMR